ncbi:MAG: DUF5693 family protein [Veillonella sp.]
MNLGISKLQAQVANRGFNVIVRPTNYRNVTSEDLQYLFKRLEGIPHVTGMIFAGKKLLVPNSTDETLELLHKITFLSWYRSC